MGSAGILGFVMFIAGVGPKDVNSNLSAWLEVFGLHKAAKLTSDYAVSDDLVWASAFLLAVTFLPAIAEKLPRDLRLPFSRKSRFCGLLEAAKASKHSISFAKIHNLSVTDAILQGGSAILTFRKAGFKVPDLSNDVYERTFEMMDYFSTMIPLLEAGHWKEAKSLSRDISVRIMRETKELRDDQQS